MNFRNLSKGLTLLRLNGKAGVIAQAIYSALSLSCGQCGVLSKGVLLIFGFLRKIWVILIPINFFAWCIMTSARVVTKKPEIEARVLLCGFVPETKRTSVQRQKAGLLYSLHKFLLGFKGALKLHPLLFLFFILGVQGVRLRQCTPYYYFYLIFNYWG